MEKLQLTRITSKSQSKAQEILDSSPGYYLKIDGVDKIKNSAAELFNEIPPKCTQDQKYVFLIEIDGVAIGVIDIVIGYPDDRTAFLGLLLLGEKYQGKGMGRESYLLLEKLIKQFNIDSIQLGVNDTNIVGMEFWSKLGFVRNGRSRFHNGLKRNSTVFVMEKKLNN